MELMEITKKCLVCSADSTEPHFGADVCRACAAFFRRRVLSPQEVSCDQPVPCQITSNREIKQCKQCRMDKCLAIGMQIACVQGKRDNHDNMRKTVTKIVPWCYSKIIELPGSSQDFQGTRLNLLHQNFNEMLKNRRNAFPKKKLPRSLHLVEALGIFRKDVRFAKVWINSTFPELLDLDDAQQTILFRNFYLKFTIFEPAFLALLLGKPNTYHLPTGDTVDEVSRYYTRHLPIPPSHSLDEISRVFTPFWTDFRTTLVDPVIESKLTIHEFLLLSAICLWDVGLDGQSQQSIDLCNNIRQHLFHELHIVCKNLEKREDPFFRFARNMLLLPSIQRGVTVFEEELQLGGLYRFLGTETDDWYNMVNGPT